MQPIIHIDAKAQPIGGESKRHRSAAAREKESAAKQEKQLFLTASFSRAGKYPPPTDINHQQLPADSQLPLLHWERSTASFSDWNKAESKIILTLFNTHQVLLQTTQRQGARRFGVGQRNIQKSQRAPKRPNSFHAGFRMPQNALCSLFNKSGRIFNGCATIVRTYSDRDRYRDRSPGVILYMR
jgi:hypothetical protein